MINRARGGTAAVLIEPVGPESGTRPLPRDFNAGVRALCDKYGALLVFDEVVTGFRIGHVRGPGLLRRRARPDRVRQGGRRWLPVGRRPRRQARVHEAARGRARGRLQEGPGRRHHGGQPAVVGGGVLHPRGDGAPERRRAGRGDGGPAHRRAARGHRAARPAVRHLQPGLHRAPADRRHPALRRGLQPDLGGPGQAQGDQGAQDRDGGDGRCLHGRGRHHARGIQALHECGAHRRRPSTRQWLPSTACSPTSREHGSERGRGSARARRGGPSPARRVGWWRARGAT